MRSAGEVSRGSHLARLLQGAEDCVPRTSKAGLIVSLDEACQRWAMLDESVLGTAEKQSWKDLLQQMTHGTSTHNDELRQHFQQVQELFSSFQQCLACSVAGHARTRKFSEYAYSKSDVQNDLQHVPELEGSSNGKLQFESISSESAVGTTSVLTLQVSNPRTGQIHQRIELLETHSLFDLREVMYCVHDKIAKNQLLPQSEGEPDSDLYSSDYFIIDNVTYPFLTSSTQPGMSSQVETTIRTSQDDATGTVSVDLPHKPKKRLRLNESIAARAQILLLQRQAASKSLTNSISDGDNILPADDNTSYPTQQKSLRNWKSLSIIELNLRMGQSFSLHHFHGSCSHIIQVLDKRSLFLRTEDLNMFPRESYRMLFRRRRCQICDLMNANFMVANDRLAEKSVSFMCNSCYEMLHYDSNGQLVYSDFSVFPYVHDT
jgi:hypothetical protein